MTRRLRLLSNPLILSTVLCVPLAAMAVPPAPAASVDARVGTVTGAKGVKTLPLYANPSDAKPLGEIAVKDLKFPMPVTASDPTGFVQVRLGGRLVWLDAMPLDVEPAVGMACNSPDHDTPGSSAGMQGAARGCR